MSVYLLYDGAQDPLAARYNTYEILGGVLNHNRERHRRRTRSHHP